MAAPPVLFTATINGEKRKVVAEGSKAGQWWAWDAATGEVIYDGVPFAKIDHPEPTTEGVLVWPGITGGANYAPQSYDPTTNYYLIANVESPVLATLGSAEQVERRARGDVDFGATFSFPPNITPYGTYVAIDMETGEVAYDRPVPGPLRGGFTTTASGLGFFGGTRSDTYIHAIDTSTGDIIWSFAVGAEVYSAPTIYMVDGEQYVALAVGGGTGGTASRIETFKLGGDKSQIAFTVPAPGGAVMEAPTEMEAFLTLNPNLDEAVFFNAVAAFDDVNNTFNYNGYADGDLTVTVPVNWSLGIRLWNLDARNPHSVMITTEQELEKGRDFEAAFVGAYTPEPIAGFVGEQVQSLDAGSVSLGAAGTYTILCAVPGHAAQGMWISLVVDADATVPTLTTSDGQTVEAAPAAGS